MNKKLRYAALLALLALALAACTPQAGLRLVAEGGDRVKAGASVEIRAVAGDELTSLEWSLSDASMGELSVAPGDPTRAVFTANPGVFGSVTVTASGEQGTASLGLFVGEMHIVGARAWNFDRQGGGEVQSPENRGYGPETVISHWNFGGHWLEWDLDVPATGEYALVIRYATNRDPHLTKRELRIDGEVAIPVMTFNNTGGFAGPASGSDIAQVAQWNTAVFRGVHVEEGRRTLRITHVGDDPSGSNGLNFAYLALVALGDMELTDALLIEIEKAIGVQREARHWM